MTIVNRSALVAKPAQSLYNLVLDVASYPEFLPWCSKGEVREQTDDRQIATVSIDTKIKEISFTTENSLTPVSQIDLQLIEGPFRSLSGQWRFLELSADACKVELDLEFEFASGALALAIRPVFGKIAESMLDAFVKRAGSQ